MQKVPYVRHGASLKKVYKDRINKWDVSVRSLANLNGFKLIRKLQKNGMLPVWKGRTCPHCGEGQELAYVRARKIWSNRCSKKGRQRFVQPHDFHPLFFGGAGNSMTPLEDQASILCCALAGVPVTAASVALGLDNKPVERVYHNLEMARARHVALQEKQIRFGARDEWPDVEVDEVDLGKEEVEDSNIIRLHPILTKLRAPGPGPIRKRDWKPIAKKHLEGRNVILHSDGARAYKMKVKGVIHDSVVHKKKRVTINGKSVWQKPHYTKVCTHILPSGKKIKVKSGTQIIDRFWQHLRTHLKHTSRKPDSPGLMRRVRAAQWTYWHRGDDLWKATSQMVQDLIASWGASNPHSIYNHIAYLRRQKKVSFWRHHVFSIARRLPSSLFMSARAGLD